MGWRSKVLAWCSHDDQYGRLAEHAGNACAEPGGVMRRKDFARADLLKDVRLAPGGGTEFANRRVSSIQDCETTASI